MAFDWQPNELKMIGYAGNKIEEIIKQTNQPHFEISFMNPNSHYDVRPYQTTNTSGGAAR